jgi:acetyl esterase/lipase
MRIASWTLGLLLVLAILTWGAFHVSPWPAALLIRWAFESGAARTSAKLERHVPKDVVTRADLRYDPDDPDAYLDVFHPPIAAGEPLPTVLWVHGGGFVSGSRKEIANYARVVAGRGYTVVGIGYTLAPRGRHPLPVRQVNAALAYLVRNAQELRVDPARVFLAGDSAGAHISLQYGLAVAAPEYAGAIGIVPALKREQLRGLVLFCGPYDASLIDLDGAFGGFLRTVLWSYSGSRDHTSAPGFSAFSLLARLVPELPPLFVSAGNADPLLRHSQALVDAAIRKGIAVDALFFAPDRQPPLEHEYQFDLDTDAGKLALERAAAFFAARR